MDNSSRNQVTEICIQIRLENCVRCPYAYKSQTYSYKSYELTCRSVYRIIDSEITFEEDAPPVPEWCPFRVDRKEKENKKNNIKRFIALMKEDDE